MITWPLFSDQFYNEKFVEQLLKIGVSLLAQFVVQWGDEKFGVVMKKEQLKRGIDELMDGGWIRKEKES
jgi:hypothetical protein